MAEQNNKIPLIFIGRLALVLLCWPVSVAAGWWLGDWDGLIFSPSWRAFPFPLTSSSPGIWFVVLTLVSYSYGILLYLNDPHSQKIAFWILSISATLGGVATFLLGFTVTLVIRSV